MNIRDSIGALLIVAFVTALGLMFWKAVPADNKDLITYMLGQLSGFVGGVIAAHYTINAGAEKLDAKRADNTKAAFEAITATAQATTTADPNAIHDGDTLEVNKA